MAARLLPGRCMSRELISGYMNVKHTRHEIAYCRRVSDSGKLSSRLFIRENNEIIDITLFAIRMLDCTGFITVTVKHRVCV